MRTSKKVISLILSVVMVLSMATMAFAGTLKTDTYNTVEKLIATDSLAEIAGSLITDIDKVKEDVAGTVLRLVFTFLDNKDLKAIIGDKNVSELSDDEAASILLKWTDKLLKDNTKSLTDNSTYKTVVNAIRIATFGTAKIDLSNTKSALATVYSLGNMKAVLGLLGDAKNLNVKSLNGVKNKSDKDTLYAVISFLKDNISLIKKAIQGKIDLGIGALNDMIKDAMNGMKNLPLFLKSYLYLLIDGHAAAGKFSEKADEAKGDWGKDANYSGFNADELLAAALLRLVKEPAPAFVPGDVDGNNEIEVTDARYALRAAVGLDVYEPTSTQFLAADTDGNGEIEVSDARNILRAAVGLPADIVEAPASDDVIVTKDEADAALKLSVYDLLATYAGDLYNRYAITWINEKLPEFINWVSVTDDIKAIFNAEIPTVDKDTLAEEIAAAKETGILGQVNNIIVKVADLVLTPEVNAKLALTKGANKGNLNANLEKIVRMALPLMANETVSKNLKFDFTGFTADKIKDMKIEDMSVAILKLFFKTWFGKNEAYNEKAVADAATLEQLAVLATYYTATNTDWLTVDFDFSGFDAQIFDGDKVKTFTAEETTSIVDAIGVGIGAGALVHNAGTTNYNVPAEAATWTTDEFIDDISDWALNYVKGIPAAVKAKNVSIARNTYDPYEGNAFNKINLVLNQLIDFSFLSNVGKEGYTLALDTLLNDAILGNVLDFNVEGLLAIFEKNSNQGNLLNTPYTVVSAALNIVDRAISCLFNVQ